MSNKSNNGKQNNGLVLIKELTDVKPCMEGNLDSQLQTHWPVSEDGYFIAYLDYKVLIGRYNAGEFITPDENPFDSKFIQKLRIFNEKQELTW